MFSKRTGHKCKRIIVISTRLMRRRHVRHTRPIVWNVRLLVSFKMIEQALLHYIHSICIKIWTESVSHMIRNAYCLWWLRKVEVFCDFLMNRMRWQRWPPSAATQVGLSGLSSLLSSDCSRPYCTCICTIGTPCDRPCSSHSYSSCPGPWKNKIA